jgi:predicted ATPase/Tfp pilus assembly protein PilF
VGDYKDGVWWVSLGALRDHELIEPTIAQVVGAKNGLVDHLRSKQMLLLLDNFEQLLDAAPRIAALLGEAPDVRVLATSRERLGVAAEHEYPVPTMVPGEALALFTARARQLKPDFEPDEDVVEICRRLDGLPLAVELAAARIKVLQPEQILERLGRSLDLLTTGPRDAPERQQTLRATIEWSHRLLSDSERQLFARLAVFAGSFDLEAVEVVCEADLTALAALVDKSLLRKTVEGRFFMLETIREYGAERLETDDDIDALRRRHALHYREKAGAAGSELATPRESVWRPVLDAELANLRAAATWGLEADVDTTLRILGSLWRFYEARPAIGEARWMLAEALNRSSGEDPRVRVEALFAAARLGFRQGDYEDARVYLEESLELAEENALRANVALSLAGLGWVENCVGSPAKAVELSARAVALARSIGVDWVLADALNNLGCALVEQRLYAEARVAHEEALSIRSRIGEQEGTAASLANLGLVALAQGRFADANGYFEKGMAVAEQRGDPWLQAMNLLSAAELASKQGDSRRVTNLVEEALELARKHGYTGVELDVEELLKRGDLLVDRKNAGLAGD